MVISTEYRSQSLHVTTVLVDREPVELRGGVGVTGGWDNWCMPVAGLVDALDGLVHVAPESLGDRESIVELHRQLARLEAVVTRAAAAFDASRQWDEDSAPSAAAWLATRCGLRRQAARRRVRLGRELRSLPVCEEAWLAGDVTGSHVAMVASARNQRTASLLARDEQLLVDNAKLLRFEAFARTVAYWLQRADPDGAEDEQRRRWERRDMYLARSFDGMWLGRITLDPVSGAVVADELKRREQELFDTDWAEARGRLGRKPVLDELRRTPAQRRADALVEMAARSGTAPAGGRRPAPLFTVLVDYDTLRGRVCELADGTVVTPGALVPWLDEAMVERAVFHPSGRVEVSETARLFTGATRRGIQVRDRECCNEFCDVPAERCEVDHIVPSARGGPTTQGNGRLLCDHHNRRRQERPPPPPG